MDERTLAAYDRDAARLAARYDSCINGVDSYFDVSFPRGSRVLDIGSGSGRDVARLVAEDREAYGVEPTAAMRDATLLRRPELAERILAGALPHDLPDLEDLGGPFDGVLCSAVLQHLPRHALFDAVFAIRGMLRAHGRALVSVPEERPDLDGEGRDSSGRLFTTLASGEIVLLFERAGFRSIGTWRDGDGLGRDDHRWVTLLFELTHDAGDRPLDVIETVLSRDPKTATYKLALLRALGDIAATRPRLARWRPDGRVGVPVDEVADRWVLYYWPLIEADAFIPQMNGDWSKKVHRLGFARELERLIDHYRSAGGLRAFALDQREGVVEHRGAPYTPLRRALRQVIVKGPVQYAGLTMASGRLFEYERPGTVLLDGNLWRELSLMGHWIQDALLLRWAELSSRMSQGEVPTETVVSRLLVQPLPERETSAARDVFETLPDLECAWSGQSLRSAFHVDHVIPFALWRSNDLWNLLPVHGSVNSSKSDRLPKRDLLARRRDVILRYWGALSERLPRRFELETRALTGRSRVCLNDLMSVLLESIEVTAIQRGAERWEP